jgi:hypothetical protein
MFQSEFVNYLPNAAADDRLGLVAVSPRFGMAQPEIAAPGANIKAKGSQKNPI